MTPLAPALRRLRPPRRLRVTPEGRWFLLVTVGVGAAAINTGNNMLYLALGMNLSLIILSGVLSEWCLRRLSVRVRSASEAFASRDSLLAVTCASGATRFPSLSVTCALSIGGERCVVRFPEVPAGGSATRVVPWRPARRGAVSRASGAVSTRFPFGLFEKSADIVGDVSLVVYPRPGEAGPETAAGADDTSAESLSRTGRPGPAIHGVREHLPADAVRDIHWKASARMGRWMVKEREKESGPVAELRVGVPAPPAAFERSLSRACGLVLRCERDGRAYRLHVGDRAVAGPSDPRRRAKALSALALASPDGTIAAPPAPDVVPLSRNPVPDPPRSANAMILPALPRLRATAHSPGEDSA